ncbi:MAG: hypothetical protein AB1714_02050, partial [Acidobacteriota bacterium]
EKLAQQMFYEETPRRRRTLLYYALRKYSALGVSEVARRCERTPSAISLAVRRLDEEAARNQHLRAGLDRLAASLSARCG